MGRDGLYELLGAVWLSEGEEYRERLVKEALKRGSGEERQRYSQIKQRKNAIIQRLQEITSAQDALNLRDNQIILPTKPSNNRAIDKNTKTLGLSSRSTNRSRQEEAESEVKRQQYTQALRAYHAQNSTVLSERLKLMAEYLALQSEFALLEETEQWLLLSMAIKNQSSLLGYMQGSDGK